MKYRKVRSNDKLPELPSDIIPIFISKPDKNYTLIFAENKDRRYTIVWNNIDKYPTSLHWNSK